MEKKSFVVMNGGMRLPIGYRFHPTDEELLVHYLKRKVFGLPLPASVILEFDVFQTDPWSLPGDLKEKRYFFSRKKGNGKRVPAGSGFWKPTCKRREIADPASNQPVGMRKTLVFKQGIPPFQTKTQWVMHEYSLYTNQMSNKMRVGSEWVVYCIFQRKRRPQRQAAAAELIVSNSSRSNKSQLAEVMMIRTSLLCFKKEEMSFEPSSPCSSGVTEVSYSDQDQDQEITSFNGFFSK